MKTWSTESAQWSWIQSSLQRRTERIDVSISTEMMNGRTGNAGFTLLEIMLAMLVLGMIVSMVSITISSSINAIDATTEQGDVYYRAQVAMERIREDLSSAVLQGDVEFIGGKNESDIGRAGELSFASMAHLVFDRENGQPGMGLIHYAVRPDSDDEQQLLLLRTDVLYRPLGEGIRTAVDGEAFLLSDRLRSVQFSFFDRDGEELETWNTTVEEGGDTTERRLPVAVSCRLEFWINQDEETTIAFETTVILPVGLVQPEGDQDE